MTFGVIFIGGYLFALIASPNPQSTPDIAQPIIANVVAIIVAAFAIFKIALDFQAYKELDSNYMEITKEGITYPFLRDKSKTSNYKQAFDGDQKLSYESYAYMVWNICETIYDRKKVNKTWLPVIKAEKELHFNWLEDNKQKFKEEFLHFIMQNEIPLRHGWLSE